MGHKPILALACRYRSRCGAATARVLLYSARGPAPHCREEDCAAASHAAAPSPDPPRHALRATCGDRIICRPTLKRPDLVPGARSSCRSVGGWRGPTVRRPVRPVAGHLRRARPFSLGAYVGRTPAATRPLQGVNHSTESAPCGAGRRATDRLQPTGGTSGVGAQETTQSSSWGFGSTYSLDLRHVGLCAALEPGLARSAASAPRVRTARFTDARWHAEALRASDGAANCRNRAQISHS